MANEISLNPPPPTGGISLSPTPRVIQDEGVLRNRILKADFALAEASPGQDELGKSFYLGMEQRVREMAALEESVRARKEWQQTSADLVRGATFEGRELTPEENAYIRDVPQEEVISDRTALEERYARRLVNEGLSDELSFPEAKPVSEEARSYVTKQQIAQRISEEMQQKYADTSWGSWAADMGKSIIPFYTWAKTRNRIVEGESLMTGSNIAEQLRTLYLLPADEFEEKLQEAVSTLAEDNIVDANMLAQAAVAFSTSSELWDNAFFGLDVVDVATLGGSVLARSALKGAVGSAKAVGRVSDTTDPVSAAARQSAYDANRNAFSMDFGALPKKAYDLAEESANPRMTQADLLVVKGDARRAAEDATRDTLKKSNGEIIPGQVTSPERVLDDLQQEVPGLLDPKNYLRSAGSLSGERQRRLLESLTENQQLLARSLVDLPPVVRIDDAAADLGFKNAEKEFRRTNFRLEDAIVEVSPVRESAEVFGGVDHIQVLLGRKDALPFVSPAQAENYAKNTYKLPAGSYTIRQKGGSYFLGMEKTVDETNAGVLDLRLSTDNMNSESFVNKYIGWIRNPDDVRSKEASAWAKVATYGGNAVMAKMAEVAKSLGRMGKNESERLSSIIDEARFKKRAVLDPDGNTVQVSGRFYKDVQELEQAYTDRGFPLPSQKEIEGYFSFRQLMEYDYSVRNISVYRDKARQGIDQKQVGWIHTGEDGKKQYKMTSFFEGKTLDALPNRSTDFTVAWYDGKTGKTGFGLANDPTMNFKRGTSGSKWDQINDLMSQGYKVIQVAEPKNKELGELVKSMGEPVQYLVVRDMKEKPLSGVQVPWNEGGHWIYPQTGGYIKQALTHKTGYGRRIYDGDVTAHYAQSTKEGARLTDAYEQARQMVKNNDPNLDAFAQRNLPYTGDEFKALFRHNNPEGAFDVDTPFVMTGSGQRAIDTTDLSRTFNEPIIDSQNHSLLNEVNQQYAQSRGERLTSVKNMGTEANPIFKLSGAPLMDSMEALARSSAQLAKSRYFDDYKHRVVEDWVTQFADIMDVPIQALRADPYRYLRDADQFLKTDTMDAPKLAAARNSRRSLLYLMNTKSDEQKQYSWFRQSVINGLTSLPGTKTIVDPMLWTSTTDPKAVARGAVFHMKLGMLNAVQYPLQAQAILHAAAIDGSPIRAAQANFLFWSMRMRGLSEGNAGAQSMFAKAASRALGVRQDHVDEMYQMFKNTGMSQVEGEYARLDDYLNPRELFGAGGVRKGLDAATVFFKEGNLTHKGVSFATSYLRHRAANPEKVFDARDVRQIVERADLYYLNMSRASNTPFLAEGAISVPAQFTTFHKNLMEQLLGGRLTAAEKARVMTMYSTVYGVPVGAGLALAPIWPVHEGMRQYALENGMDIDSDMVTKVAMEGLAQVAIELLSGENFNFAERYGPGGLSWLQDIVDGSFLEVAGGPSGNSILDAIERAAPFGRALLGVFNGDSDYYPLTSSDFLDAAREISSINNAARAYFAVTAGQYMTKSDTTVMKFDADGVDAMLMGVFGLSPQEVSDTYLKLRSNKQDSDAKASIGKEVLTQFRRAAKASAQGEPELAYEFYKRAHTLIEGAGMTPKERADLFGKAVRENGTLLDKVDRNFMLRDPQKRMNTYLNKPN